MSQNQSLPKPTEKKAVFIDAFGHIVSDEQNALGVPGGDGLLRQYDVELDKSTGETKIVEKDPIDIPALVKSYEDACGMEWARRALRSGQITPEELADDGKHGGDFTGPDNINDAYRAARAAKVEGDKVAAVIGAEGYMNEKDLDAYVTAKVEALMKAQEAKAAPASEGDKK